MGDDIPEAKRVPAEARSIMPLNRVKRPVPRQGCHNVAKGFASSLHSKCNPLRSFAFRGRPDRQ